jgi:outer membrane protein assembly factor BamB
MGYHGGSSNWLFANPQATRSKRMSWTNFQGRLSLAMSLVLILLVRGVHAESNWPAWGGPDGSNHSHADDLPLKWSKQSVVWKTALPGIGQSTPVIWGDQIFLTTAQDSGQKRIVLCADRQSGKILWERTAWTGTPEETHKMNGWASATCATDGEVVVAFFGRGGLHAYRATGEHLWTRDLGAFAGPWGTAASPRIVGDLVIQNCDSESPAALLALDKNTGATVWQAERESMRGWSTPLLVQADGRQQLVLNGHGGVRV